MLDCCYLFKEFYKERGVNVSFKVQHYMVHFWPGTEFQGGHVPSTFGQGVTQYLLSPPNIL